MLELIKKHNIPDDGVQSSIASCPAQLFFLQESFIRKYWQSAELPAEKLDETIAFATYLNDTPQYRYLAWHLYRYCTLTPLASFRGNDLPDIIDGLGVKSGMLYLLIALSMIPTYEERAVREGFPVEYGRAGAKRIGSTTCFFAQKFDGAFGLRGNTLPFQLHYRETATWRIGRFDYQPRQAGIVVPVIYAKDGEVTALCPDGAMYDACGDRTEAPEKAVRKTTLSENGSTVTGTPIDPVTGIAGKETVTLNLQDGWKKIVGADDWTLFFHIPGGGGMTPELCRESFAEALEFFRSYMPDKDFKVIWSSSWIFNPAWAELMPQSNMAKLINSGYLFPTVRWEKYPGLYFVFGERDGRPEDFDPRNTVEKAVIKCMKENRLRSAGLFLLPETAGK